MHSSAEITALSAACERLAGGFCDLPRFDKEFDPRTLADALAAAAEHLKDNSPYHHPLYIGQMIKPPHPVARWAYALAMGINPNNHALDGGRASSRMEKEAVASIAAMWGWPESLGHLCSGGTIANFEALWVARELQAEPAFAASSQAHYTHSRLSSVLGVPFVQIPVDALGRMDPTALRRELQQRRIGTVVATLGTTAAGTVDPLQEILALRAEFGFRLHVDAAYGGYFKLARNLSPSTQSAFAHAHLADSIVIDPHKHGMQPYGCGCVLFHDSTVGHVYRHDSPYTYFSSDALHLGEISLECSRPGAAAVALWTTMRVFPLEPGGYLGQGLESGREAALELHAALERDDRFAPLFPPELDIVVWAVRADSASQSSARAQAIFTAAAEHDLHLALARFPKSLFQLSNPVSNWDADEITCLRACVMKREHRDWMQEIIRRLHAASTAIV